MARRKKSVEQIAPDDFPQPQPGPQTTFLGTDADIAIYGGAAGGGKSFGLLLEATRFVNHPGFGGVIFRRTLSDVKKEGSIWDSSFHVFPYWGGRPRMDNLSWRFGGVGGVAITFSHLEHEKNMLDWMGAQVPFIGFDELTHFSKKAFFYMLSRNRTTCGVRPYVRATCNPDADSWVREFISWWIDDKSGFAIMERSGILRWFIRDGDNMIWGDSKEELTDSHPGSMPKSVTFIPSTLDDNKILCEQDPNYRANLLALSKVDRERLLNGNWNIRPSSGLYFQRHWCEIVDVIPAGTKFVRGWDKAATPKTEQNDPDATCGTKIGRCPDGRFIVADHIKIFGAPERVKGIMRTTAERDGRACRIHVPQDPASAGKADMEADRKNLAGFNVRFAVNARGIPGGDAKLTRFSPFSAQADPGTNGKYGNVIVLRGNWNETWFNDLEAFPESKHDDSVDSTSEAFNGLAGRFARGEALLMLTTQERLASPEPKPEPITIEYAKGSVEYQEQFDNQ